MVKLAGSLWMDGVVDRMGDSVKQMALGSNMGMRSSDRLVAVTGGAAIV